jgi:hypothetical protein
VDEVLDGAEGDVQSFGDLAIAEAGRDERRHLLLALGLRVERLGGQAIRRPVALALGRGGWYPEHEEWLPQLTAGLKIDDQVGPVWDRLGDREQVSHRRGPGVGRPLSGVEDAAQAPEGGGRERTIGGG